MVHCAVIRRPILPKHRLPKALEPSHPPHRLAELPFSRIERLGEGVGRRTDRSSLLLKPLSGCEHIECG